MRTSMSVIPAALCLLAVAGCDPEAGGKRIGALDAKLWEKSEWIAAADAKAADEAARKNQRAADGTSWFVREIANEGEVTSAKWMTSGLGTYELYVNGIRVGSDALKPGFTHVRRTRRSFTYDVTKAFRKAAGEKNFLAAEVSAGWWRDKIVNYAGVKSAFRGVLEVAYADGTVRVYGTSAKDWLASVGGPVTHAGIFDGEEYDARIAPPTAGGEGFKPAEKSTEFEGEILPSDGGEICRRFDLLLRPVEAYVWQGVDGADASKGVFGRVHRLRDVAFDGGTDVVVSAGETLVVDFGQNCAGVPGFLFKADEGVTLTCLPAEMLNDRNGERARGNDGPGGSVYRENLRMPASGMRLKYTFGKPTASANGGFSVYWPKFTFFGYRYVSVTATADVTIRAIASIPVTSIAEDMEIGSITTGSEDVNKLISNIYWGQLSNYLSVPTDCPQRNERLGWSADTQVFTEAGSFNADTSKFFRKWTRDLRDSRSEDGGYPSVAPFAQYGNETFNLGWADVGVIVPYQIWKQFGDTQIVDENFDAMMKFVRRLDETKYDFEGKVGYIYADWLSYQKFESCGNAFGSWDKWGKDPDAQNYRRYLAACYWLYDARLVAEMAEATGRRAEAEWLRASEKRALAYIRGRFLESDGLLLKPMRDLQTASVFAIHFGIVEGPARRQTKELLLKSIRESGDCLQTGFLGTAYIMDALTEAGAVDVAYTLLLQHRNPSWLYSVDQGATTIWERWNSYTKENGFGPVGMNSFNHYAYGAVLAWMYREMAGIAADPKDPGFARIVMAPKPDRRIGFVKAKYKSAAGLVTSAWRYEGEKWIWDFTVPEGSLALVTMPGEVTAREYKPGTYHVER